MELVYMNSLGLLDLFSYVGSSRDHSYLNMNNKN